MQQYCSRCQRRYTVGRFNTDYVHKCNSGNSTLDQEDVVVIATNVDEYGEKFVTKGKNSIMMQGLANAQDGTRASTDGMRKSNTYTNRGNNAKTTRQRQHYQYEELKGDDIGLKQC